MFTDEACDALLGGRELLLARWRDGGPGLLHPNDAPVIAREARTAFAALAAATRVGFRAIPGSHRAALVLGGAGSRPVFSRHH